MTEQQAQAMGTETVREAPPAGTLSLKTHICYGLSQQGLNCIGTAFGINALFFYSTVLHFNTMWFGIIMLIAQVWDAFSGPLIGHFSDNTRWKRGRRRPFFLMGAIPFGIAFFLVFSPPGISDTSYMFSYLLMMVLLMLTSRAIFEMPYLALAPELTPNYNERTKLSGYRQLFGTLGDAQGAILPLVLVGLFHEQRRPAHLIYGLIAAITMIIAAEITRRGTFESGTFNKNTHLDFRDSFNSIIRNWPFLLFIFANAVATMANNIVTYLVLFVTKYWFLNETLATRFFIAFFIGAIISVPAWVKLSDMLGKKWTYVFDLAGYGILLCGILVIPRDGQIAATALIFFSGMFNVGLWILSGTNAPDIIEWDEYHTGKRREGIYTGVWTFSYKAGMGVAIAFAGFALKIIGFKPELAAQSETTLFRLKLLFGPIPALFLLAGAGAFLFYPITRSRHEEMCRIIRERVPEKQ